jgi:hypothetical protein
MINMIKEDVTWQMPFKGNLALHRKLVFLNIIIILIISNSGSAFFLCVSESLC